jgi:cell division protein FtsW
MDRKKRFPLLRMPQGYNKYIHYSVLGLAVFGSVMVVSASMTITSTTVDLLIVGAKQIFYLVAGYFGMLFLARKFSFDFVRRHIVAIVAITFVFLLITLAFPSVGGARAWIRIPFPGTELTLQPSEFAKIVAILMFAVYLGDLPKNIARKSSEIMGPPIFTLVGMFMIMVVLQRDLGTAVVLFVICFFVFLLPSHRKLRDWQRPALFMSAFVSAVLLFLMSDPGIKLLKSIDKGGYQLQRFLAAYNPFAIAQEGGYQIVSSLIAITKGNWIGGPHGFHPRYHYRGNRDDRVYDHLGILRIDYLPSIQRHLSYDG